MPLEWHNLGEVKAGINATPQKVGTVLYAATEYWSPRIEGYAKDNASWTDRTGNARQGLAARPEHETLKHSIILAHGVFYGIYLETRFSGRYAIIWPTVLHYGPQIMLRLTNSFARIEAVA